MKASLIQRGLLRTHGQPHRSATQASLFVGRTAGVSASACQQSSWDMMFTRLLHFKDRNGHCNVPVAYAPDPCLGRWVAHQRYRRDVGALSPVRLHRLERMGFVWTPRQDSWSAMFCELRRFKAEHGHCSVSVHDARHRALGVWAKNQRQMFRIGKLPPHRKAMLDELGFVWFQDRLAASHSRAVRQRLTATRLRPAIYMLDCGSVVVYSGKGRPPNILSEYLHTHKGRVTRVIELPRGTAVFRLTLNGKALEVRITQRTRRIPKPLIDYAVAHGQLPPCSLAG